MVPIAVATVQSRDPVFGVNGGMPGTQAEIFFDPPPKISRFKAETEPVGRVLEELPFCVGGIAVRLTIVLRAEGKTKKISTQILQQIRKISLQLVGLPGSEGIRGEF